nr:CARDB domain-containing protein [Cohnella sp. REN36]
MDATGSALVFSTFLGGSSSDTAFGIAVDGSGSAYLTGQTASANFPVTPGAFQPALAGGGDVFVTKIGAIAEVSLLKFSDRFEVRPGETVTFFIEVSNPSTVTLTNVRIEDPLLGFFTVIPELPAFAVQIFEVLFTVPPGTPPGFITNVVTVTSDQIPEPQIAKSDIFVTETPMLLAFKTVNPPAAAPGETVVFTITLVNEGNVDLINVQITDPLIGLDERVGNIPVGASVTIDWPFVIPPDALAGVTIANTVIITANNLPEPETVGTVVDVLAAPRLTLTKTADRTVVPPGETVTFTLTLSNSGNTALTNIAVTDDLTGFSTIIPLLAVGQTELLHIPFLVPLETPPQTFLNTVTAASNETAPESASAEFTVSARPLLGVSKTPSSTTVTPGQTFTYTVTLSNIGNVPLTNIHVTDPLLGLKQTIAALAVGETVELVIPFTVPQETPIGSDIVNLLTVTSAEAGTQEIESTVTVTGEGLALSKQPSRTFAAPGETVTFTLTVTNLLAAAQTNIVLSDPLLGISETVPLLPANGTITRTGSFTVPAGAANGSIITNTFTASSDQTPLQEATAEIVVRSVPGAETTLAAQKLPDRNEAAPGETVHYTVQVTNTGSNPATNVVVRDSLTGTVETITVIAPGETVVVTFSFTIPAAAVNGTVIANRVIVTWPEQPPGSLPVQSEARITVAEPIGLPELTVQATPSTANPGETVTKTITITNVTNRTITNVRVTDSLVGFRTVIPSLAPRKQRVFTLPFTIPAGTIGETVFLNTVTIFSDQTPQQQETVSIRTASLPDAELTETVNRPQGRPGETVFFTIQVRNTGNVALINAQLTAPLLGIQLRIARFEVGASEIIRVPFVLPNVQQTTVITSPVTFSSDNGPTRRASASVLVIAEEEE